MEGHVEPGAYKDVVLFLATAGVVVPLFRRWRLSPILGFMVAGVLLGPYGLGALAREAQWLGVLTIENPGEVAQLAEFGVVFLLFMIGLELSWERLKSLRRYVFGLGALQVGLCLSVTAGTAMLIGQPPLAALAIGAALALSSTAMVMPILAEQKRQHAMAGRVTFSVLLFQDLAVAPILVTLTLLKPPVEGAAAPNPLLTFLPAVLGIAALFAFGRLLLRPMLKSVARARSEELFVAACLLVVIGAGLVSALTGLSMALGAFIAGLLLAETEFRHEVEVVIEAALLLAGAGEFAFVILAQAMTQGLVSHAVGETALVAATLSMFSIPFLAQLGLKLGGRKVQPVELPAEPGEPGAIEPRVLVVGYGRVGRLVGDMLSRHEIGWVAAELDSKLVDQGRRAGKAIFFGDASREEFLMRCGLADAPALVVTMDDAEGVEAIVAVARALRPKLTIVARARDARHAQRLYDLGVTDAVPETMEASLQLSEAVLVEIGVPMGLVIASIHERRDEFRAQLNRPESLGGRTRRFRREAQS
jgi:CPA2 family monovalent cation:H+ antiporter-2